MHLWHTTALKVIAPIALLVALVGWAFASPIGSSPDDDYHMASIWCGSGIREGLCEPGDEPGEMRVPKALVTVSSCYAYDAAQSASCDIAPSNVMVTTNRGNFTGSYPPIYYATMSLFASENIAVSVIAMRVFNATLFIGILGVLYIFSGRRQRIALLAGTLVTMVPLGMFIVPSLNPSSWAVLSAAGLWVALSNFYEATTRTRRAGLAAFALLLTVMGAGARSDSAVYSGIAVLVAAALAFQRTRRFATSSWLGIAVIGISLVFFFNAGQSALVSGAPPPTERDFSDLVFDNLLMLPELWVGVFGFWGLGWLDTAMPGTVWVTALSVFVGLCFWGMKAWNLRKGIAVALIALSLIVVPMYVYIRDGVMVGGYVQPRYVYPLIIMLAGVLLFGRLSPLADLRRVQTVTLIALLSAANAIALHVNIRRYVTGADVTSPNLEIGLEWWWPLFFGPNWMWAFGSIAFVTTLIAVYLLGMNADRHSAGSPLSDEVVHDSRMKEG